MYIREQASKQASKEASLYFPIIKLVTLNNLQLFRNYHKNFSISLFFVPPLRVLLGHSIRTSMPSKMYRGGLFLWWDFSNTTNDLFSCKCVLCWSMMGE